MPNFNVSSLDPNPYALKVYPAMHRCDRVGQCRLNDQAPRGNRQAQHAEKDARGSRMRDGDVPITSIINGLGARWAAAFGGGLVLAVLAGGGRSCAGPGFVAIFRLSLIDSWESERACSGLITLPIPRLLQGVVGICAGVLGAHVLLTDLDHALDLPRQNAARNAHAVKAAGGRAEVTVHTWGTDVAPLRGALGAQGAQGVDYVVACEVTKFLTTHKNLTPCMLIYFSGG